MLGGGKAGALGTASARFLDGLPRKAAELAGAVAQVAEAPGAERSVEELRRRLHALYASAQVFHLGPLATALKDALARIDSARDRGVVLSPEDLGALRKLAGSLPDFGRGSTEEWDSVTPMRPVIALEGDGHTSAKTPSSAPPPPNTAATAAGSVRPARAPHSTLRGLQTKSDAPPAEAASVAPPRESLSPGLADAVRAAVARASDAPPASAEMVKTTPSAKAPMPLSTAVSMAVIGAPSAVDDVKKATTGAYEVVSAPDVTQGLQRIRESVPDLVMVASDLGEAAVESLVSSLRRDPLTDFVPVVVLFPSAAAVDRAMVTRVLADGSLAMPVTPEALGHMVSRVSGLATEPGMPSAVMGEMTTAELAERLAGELRRGLVDTAEHGREQKVALDDGTEVLAAAWSAIARIRSHVAQKAGGKVSFRDEAGVGGPRHLAVTFDGAETRTADDDVGLVGRRMIVADDDAGIRTFFADILRAEGVQVVECEDGAQALTSARRERPDVIISDILMPRLDGFALCRALADEPMLMDVPVILLSWKEDLLLRMRELASGASGYLRKEAGSTAIIAQVRDALRPRVRVERELLGNHDVHGRVDGVGVGTLLRSVAGARPSAVVTFRDAVTTYEVVLSEGSLVDAREVRGEAEVARGDVVLPRLSALTSARFSVGRAKGTVATTVTGGDTLFGLPKAIKAAGTKPVGGATAVMFSVPPEKPKAEPTVEAPAPTKPAHDPRGATAVMFSVPPEKAKIEPKADAPAPTTPAQDPRGATAVMFSVPPAKAKIEPKADAPAPAAPDARGATAVMFSVPPAKAAPAAVTSTEESPRVEVSPLVPTLKGVLPPAAATAVRDGDLPLPTGDLPSLPPIKHEFVESRRTVPGAMTSASMPAVRPRGNGSLAWWGMACLIAGFVGVWLWTAPKHESSRASGNVIAATDGPAGFDRSVPWKDSDPKERSADDNAAPETAPTNMATAEPLPLPAPKPHAEVPAVSKAPLEAAFRRLGGDLSAAPNTAALGERNGTIIIRQSASSQATFVRVDDRDLGAPPVTTDLPEGRHRFVFLAPNGEHYRFWYVPRHQVLTVEAP